MEKKKNLEIRDSQQKDRVSHVRVESEVEEGEN